MGAGFRKRSCAWGLFHLLARIDAPQARLLDPAVEAFSDEAAPPAVALLYGAEHAVLQLGGDAARGIGFRPQQEQLLSLIHISEPTRLLSISYAVFCLKK